MIFALLLALLAEPPSEPRQLLRERFAAEVTEIASRVDGVVGVVILDPATGDRISVHGNVVFTQASAIKLPVLVELMRQVEAGEHKLDEGGRRAAAGVGPGGGG